MLKCIISGLLLFLFLSFFNPVYGQQLVTTLDSWQESSAVIDANHRTAPLPSFAINKRYYVHTDLSTGLSNSERVLYVADQQTDGSLGAWRVAMNDHGGGPHGFTTLVAWNRPYHFRNGHIAQYEIADDGTVSDITLLEESQDTSFSGNRYVWDTAVASYWPAFNNVQFIYHLGGFDLKDYIFKGAIHRRSPSIGFDSVFDFIGTTPNNVIPYKAAYYNTVLNDGAYGYIYMIGKDDNKIYRTKTHNDGSLDPWIESANLPQGNGNNRGDMFIILDQLFIIRGSKVFQATINTQEGSLSTWSDSPPDLPVEQINMTWGGEPEGNGYAFIGDYVYVTGPDRVYYAKINRPNATTPTITVTAKPGDANGDNLVDIRDFEVLRQEFNKTGIIFKADFNNDGKVDIRDFEILRQNFNK